MPKKEVKLTIYGPKGEEHCYNTRLLGMITEQEYAIVVDRPDYRRKLISVPTTPIKDLLGNMNEGMRLAFAIKARLKDDAHKADEDVNMPTLLITDPISYVNSEYQKSIEIHGEADTYTILEEMDVKE